MFASAVRAGTLSTALGSLSVLIDECKINFDKAGIHIKAIDPATVAMVEVSLDAGACESYEARGGVVGVNVNRLEEVVGMAAADQLVHLEMDEETRKLHVRIDELEYTLALIDPDVIREEPDTPALDLPARITLEGSDIDRSVKAASMVSDHVTLGVDEDRECFYVDAEGDTDDVHLELGPEDLIDVQIGNAHSLYSLDYLQDVNKAIQKDAEVTVSLGEEFPMEIDHDFAGKDGHVTYSLAPRIQNR